MVEFFPSGDDSTATENVMGAIKLTSFIVSALIAALMITNSFKFNVGVLIPGNGQVIAEVPYTDIVYSDLSTIPTPHIEAEITYQNQTEKAKFLLDSGAKLSVLPMDYLIRFKAQTMSLKRILLRAATSDTTYGYLTEMELVLNRHKLTLPVAFAEVTEPLLGMHGFFDQYTITFDAVKQAVIIEQKG